MLRTYCSDTVLVVGSKLGLWTKSASKIWLSDSLFMHELKWHSPLNIVYRRVAANGSLRSATRLPQNALTAASFAPLSNTAKAASPLEVHLSLQEN